jgi:hypothetical protein
MEAAAAAAVLGVAMIRTGFERTNGKNGVQQRSTLGAR